MAALSSPGIGSGLDINGLVTKLMAVEQQPLVALAKKEASFQARVSAYGSLKAALSSFQTAVKGLSNPSVFNTMKATVADTAIASASAVSTAAAASYQLEVTNLAQTQKLTSADSARVTDPAGTIGTGKLTIEFGTYDGGSFVPNPNKVTKSVTIGADNSSLTGIRDAINAAGLGATATILNDGTGYRLVLTGNDSGAENAMRITVDEGGVAGDNVDMTGLSRFAYDATKAGEGFGKNMAEKQAAESATFKLDGILMTKPSNTVTDAIPGVTLSLAKESAAGVATTLAIARDASGVKTAVNGFVKAYNDLVKTTQDLGGYDAKTKKGGVLQGDAGLRGVQDQLRRLVSQQLTGLEASGFSSASDIGISFQKDGTLALDATKLDKALADAGKNVAMIFSTMGKTTDSLVSYTTSGNSTKAGTYAVEITKVPLQGSATGSANVEGLEIGAGNKALTVLVDGISASITLDEDTYTADQLVSALQSKINTALQSSGKKVQVSQSGGQLTITSVLYGGGSSVTVAGSGYADLFGTLDTVAGQDVAGTIGGVTATGSGQTLTGGGDALGLQLLVSGGASGARGNVTFSRGIAYQLDKTIQSMLDSNGTIEAHTNSINDSIKSIGRQRDALNLRLTEIEKRYRAQFNSLDRMVAQMQQTSTYLQQQLSALSAQTSSK